MALRKEKYIFNAQTLRFEKAVVGLGTRLLRVFGFLSASLIFSLIISTIYYRFIDSPKEKIMRNEINTMRDQYLILQEQVDRMTEVLEGLQYRDGNIYRVIFEAEPISDAVWQAGAGGYNKYKHLENLDNSSLLIDISKKTDKLARQLVIQSKSYDEISRLVKNKQKMLSSLPSIQPVSNRDLTRMASGFGMRLDPVYKIQKFHQGMDFTSPVGTEVYATGDGVVESVNYSYNGYGNEILINHGYGYKTRYAHLSGFKVRAGERVKRGDMIGVVGSTGKSTGPHLHYEVLKNNVAVNPVYYYYNDLKDEQFAKMLEISNSSGQSLD